MRYCWCEECIRKNLEEAQAKLEGEIPLIMLCGCRDPRCTFWHEGREE
jgi:hypothetical protein